MDTIFSQLAVVLGLSLVFGYLISKIKLPLVIAYIIAGVVLSFVSLFDPSVGSGQVIFGIFPEIAMAFLLFLIGMELDLREIRSLGPPVIVAALGQIIASSFIGYGLATLLGFSHTAGIFIGLGLSFSSTVLVIKLLLEKRDLTSLYGKLSIGILLIEDLVAVAALMVVTSLGDSTGLSFYPALPLLGFIIKAAGLFILTFVISRYLLSRIFNFSAKQPELLFLTAITWCFLFTTVAILAGFSVVIGAFLAGVALATSPYHLEIQGRIKPLRDFFVVLFFVYLGTQARFSDVIIFWPIIITLSLYALFAKPLLYILLVGLFGFRKHTLFNTSANLSQISEFSLVLALSGVQNGFIPQEVLSVMAAVAVVSMILSSLFIAYSKNAYIFFSPFMGIFELPARRHIFEKSLSPDGLSDHVVMVGANRFGGPIVEFLRREKIPFVVMDFNPHVVEELRREGDRVIYGDVGDVESLDSLGLSRAKLVISTAADIEDNEILLKQCLSRKVKAKIITRAGDATEAKILEDLGADYVIVPEKLSGEQIVAKLKTYWPKIHLTK